MTDKITYLWDASHYDGNLTTAILTRARAEGIEGFTHKLGEGLTNVDTTAGTALAAARDAGILAVGGYWFIHGNDDPVAEAKRCIAVADEHESWWRTFAGWFWQTDAETSPTGLPSPSYVKTFSDTLASLSGRRVIVYASHGMYGDRLASLGHPLWNANYPSSRKAGFKSLYPGDRFAGWAKYSGQTPVIVQYSSSATVAGLHTCDVNAFKGTIQDLLTLIGAVDMSSALANDDPDFLALIWRAEALANFKLVIGGGPEKGKPVPFVAAIQALQSQSAATAATVAGLVKSEAALQETLNALAAGGTSVNTAAIASQITALGNTESAAVAALSKQIVDLQARLAAAETAAAAALGK